MDVSICIASHRPEGLARLLESIGRLKRLDGSRFEIVVVENRVARSAVLEGFVARGAPGLALRTFVEPRRNLSLVRNRCLEAAAGDWIAFVDDDEVVREDWLLAYAAMSDAHEADGYFGPVLPRFEAPPGSVLDASFFERPRFASGTELTCHGARTGNAYIRRTAFGSLRFDPAFGRGVGEDWELFQRMQRRGARFLWCDEACVEEFVPSERMRLGWLARRAYEGGSAFARAQMCTRGPKPRLVLGALLGAGTAALALPVFVPLGRRRAARALLRLCARLGTLRGAVNARWGAGA